MISPTVGLLLTACLGILLALWTSSQGRSMLRRWTSAQGFEILSHEECWFFRGPFFWTSSKGQKVYKVRLRDREGQLRRGYVRCGGYWLGLWSEAVEVRWDDDGISSQ
ncbi:MAG: hypothetical protein JO332_05500 [Planctomycetaceae bacterium]|nr:hypothetical protein [Planctomycetaceae bacterium]